MSVVRLLYEDLHAHIEPEDKVKGGLLLDVVVRRLDLEGDGLAREGFGEDRGRERARARTRRREEAGRWGVASFWML
jgi:hypothetical protein